MNEKPGLTGRQRMRLRYLPEVADIRRRLARTIRNLFEVYALLCDELFCYDHSGITPMLVFEQDQFGCRIEGGLAVTGGVTP